MVHFDSVTKSLLYQITQFHSFVSSHKEAGRTLDGWKKTCVSKEERLAFINMFDQFSHLYYVLVLLTNSSIQEARKDCEPKAYKLKEK